MSDSQNIQIDAMLCFSLYSAHQAMNKVYQPLLDPAGLTYTQYLVLLTLWKADSQPVRQIGEALGLASNTLTPLLKRMEAAGLVKRTRSKQDERVVNISLTRKGKALQNKLAHIPDCLATASGMTMQQAKDMAAQISTLRKRLADDVSAAS